MAAPADNILKQVITYQESSLAYLDNLYCFLTTANKKFKDFQNRTANLGDTVQFDLPPRFTASSGLIANFGTSIAEQRFQSLTIDQSYNVPYSFTSQQFILNVKDYMVNFGKSATKELAANIEADVASTIPDNTYRFVGSKIGAVCGAGPVSYEDLATSIADFEDYGSVRDGLKGYLPHKIVPKIIGTGLQKFTLDINNERMNGASWDVGEFAGCNWYKSNLLPQHIAGIAGNTSGQVLTITGVTTDTDGGVSAITCTGSTGLGTVSGVIKANDLLWFDDAGGVVRYRTFIGHKPSASLVQVRATVDAASDTGSVTITIAPKLYSAAGRNQNVTTPIINGMKLQVMPSHRAGLIVGGNALYIAMPQLPDQSPFATANKVDPETGASIRMTYGARFGENQMGFVHDAIWGKTLVPEYSMRVCYPI